MNDQTTLMEEEDSQKRWNAGEKSMRFPSTEGRSRSKAESRRTESKNLQRGTRSTCYKD